MVVALPALCTPSPAYSADSVNCCAECGAILISQAELEPLVGWSVQPTRLVFDEPVRPYVSAMIPVGLLGFLVRSVTVVVHINVSVSAIQTRTTVLSTLTVASLALPRLLASPGKPALIRIDPIDPGLKATVQVSEPLVTVHTSLEKIQLVPLAVKLTSGGVAVPTRPETVALQLEV